MEESKNRVTEQEIIQTIRRIGEDSEIVEAFKSTSERELKALLQKERDKKSKAKKIQLWLYSTSSVAAILLILLLMNIYKKDSSYNLYTAYFEMPAYQSGVSRGTSNISKSFFDYYNQGLYKEALNEIKTVSDEDMADEPLLKFYASVSYMKTNNIPKATKYLSELHEANPDLPEVQWYLALAYLKERQTDKAKSLLQSIDDKMYADKAKELLEKLK